MSIKKTWFSYILWLMATGFSVLFTYSYILGIVNKYGYNIPNPMYSVMGLSAAFFVGVFVFYALIALVRNRIHGVMVPVWLGRFADLLVIFGSTVFFVVSRCYLSFHTPFENNVPMYLYEAAKVTPANISHLGYESLYWGEGLYTKFLSFLFL